ncbi:antitoxin ParD1/3/4 [Azospirillum brasilense]|uniref:Antitoxin ParD1/3/4 n=1 Tax=Azospirillum brasilense TaxID=192 RepID=A0A560BJN2_AZOBR|nr:type II toxin-antitoxin system ParD family antitoxin [Azospirillum brasilense]TWA72719.1 antitoxin ParD1/3/4 [Azospirillum brasilense]
MSRRINQSISLTPELGRFVQTLVASGRYQTASEVVREGLRLLQERVALPPASLAQPPAPNGGHDS